MLTVLGAMVVRPGGSGGGDGLMLMVTVLGLTVVGTVVTVLGVMKVVMGVVLVLALCYAAQHSSG